MPLSMASMMMLEFDFEFILGQGGGRLAANGAAIPAGMGWGRPRRVGADIVSTLGQVGDHGKKWWSSIDTMLITPMIGVSEHSKNGKTGGEEAAAVESRGERLRGSTILESERPKRPSIANLGGDMNWLK